MYPKAKQMGEVFLTSYSPCILPHLLSFWVRVRKKWRPPPAHPNMPNHREIFQELRVDGNR